MADLSPNAGITIGELIERLQAFSRDAELYMGGLHFYRLKQRGDKLVQLEFNEVVGRDPAGKLYVEEVG